MTAILAPSYDDLKKAAKKDLKSKAVSSALSSLVVVGLDYLEKKCERVKLDSKILLLFQSQGFEQDISTSEQRAI